MSNRPYRRRKVDSDSDGEEDGSGSSVNEIIESKKELMKLRKRPNGINAASLALGTKVTKLEELSMEKDPFKLKTGGLVQLRGVKDRNRDRTYEDVDRDVTNLGSTFSQETNRRDTDAQLTTYIEGQMKKVKGDDGLRRDSTGSNIKSPEDQLYQLPDHLQIKKNERSEEMLSNQMLSGIPEVDLGIESKIKNIERTEEAKVDLITEMRRKKEKKASFVPINMAVNYVQHKRYMHSSSGGDRHRAKKEKKETPDELPPLVVGDIKQRSPEHNRPASKEAKSTDNFHFEKFRKNSRYR